ncbi:glycosyltransferase [Thalassoroseus pseudoceratinae]|uniref:glycosyltransferase n=1 Tax=Thalassoroseus pseudoceratinae TaxID=2713176 RepID=UPI00142134BC|nr:glycosyltransferase [Thalassoroseus pseudoceratinae]
MSAAVIRVLSVIATLDRSGAEKQFSLLAKGLPKDEFDLHAVALTRGGPYADWLEEANIPLTILHKRMKADPVALWRLRRLVRSLQPDIVHTWLFTANTYGRLAVGKNPQPKVIVSERCVDSWKSGWQLKTDQKLQSRTDRWVVNGESVGAFYQEQGVPSEKITVIPNGVDVTDSEPLSQDERKRMLAEFDLPADARIVGYVGRLASQKRVKDLIWSIQMLRQIQENVFLLIVGDGPERDALGEFARQMTCAPFVRFAGHRQDSSNLMRLFDVFWLASEFEGMSNSLMEAMAAGVPAITSDIPPNRELVVDGETGYVVNVGDCPAFAQFADRILADSELKARLGTAARSRMREHFCIEQMVERHAELFRSITQEQNG